MDTKAATFSRACACYLRIFMIINLKATQAHTRAGVDVERIMWFTGVWRDTTYTIVYIGTYHIATTTRTTTAAGSFIIKQTSHHRCAAVSCACASKFIRFPQRYVPSLLLLLVLSAVALWAINTRGATSREHSHDDDNGKMASQRGEHTHRVMGI